MTRANGRGETGVGETDRTRKEAGQTQTKVRPAAKAITIKLMERPGVVAHAYNPSTLGGRGGWITRAIDGDHPSQHGETPSLLKIQKLAGHGGACL